MKKIEKIILHCSDSTWGTALDIDQWHRQKGWSKIGYMGVILNGWIKPSICWPNFDGTWEWGRAVDSDLWLAPDEVGAHAYGLNSNTVGICLIGTDRFTYNQYLAAKKHILWFSDVWGLKPENILGHYEVDKNGKTCPNINMDVFRDFLKDDSLITKFKLK